MNEVPDKKPRRLEVTMVKSDEAPSRLKNFESIAKILSLVAIPIAIALVGWVIQDQLASQNVSKDYVQIAVGILIKPDSEGIDPGLRSWAVDLLNQNSPTKFSRELETQLKDGTATLPRHLFQGTEQHKLAMNYLAQGDIPTAETMLRKALTLNEKDLGSEHPSTVAVMANLAMVLAQTGRLEEAELLVRKALKISQSQLGPDHIGVAQNLLQLVNILEIKKDLEEGAKYRLEALEIIKQQPKP